MAGRRPAITAPGRDRAARSDDGSERRFSAIARLDGPIDVEYYLGGILPTVLAAGGEALIAGHEEAPGETGAHAEELAICSL